MADLTNIITKVLTAFHDDIKAAKGDFNFMFEKYGIAFYGFNAEQCNSIFSHDLPIFLREKYGMDISSDDVSQVVPDVCKSLGLQIEKMVKWTEIQETNRAAADYIIRLD